MARRAAERPARAAAGLDGTSPLEPGGKLPDQADRRRARDTRPVYLADARPLGIVECAGHNPHDVRTAEVMKVRAPAGVRQRLWL
jgi:hypothetical protein